MQSDDANATISESKEESLRKALEGLPSEPAARPLIRPTVATGRVLLAFALWTAGFAAVAAAVVWLGWHWSLPAWAVWGTVLLLLILLLVCKAKRLVRQAVLLYQKHAPEKLRRACLFTPSCSEYMLLAVEKYGVVKGCCKGVGRLCRCHYPNGGEDRP